MRAVRDPEIFGIKIIEDPYLPGPRPITPGEWGERYVRYHMLAEGGPSSAALRDYPEKAPYKEPSWTDMINTVYLLPEPRQVLPAVDRPSELRDFPGKDDILALRHQFMAEMRTSLGAMVVSPRTRLDLLMITGVR